MSNIIRQDFLKWIKEKEKDYPNSKIGELIDELVLHIDDLKDDGMVSALKRVIDNIEPYIDCYLDKYECQDITDEDYETLKDYLLKLTK